MLLRWYASPRPDRTQNLIRRDKTEARQVSRRGGDVHAIYVENMTDYLLALGANLPGNSGDVTSTLSRALELLKAFPHVEVAQRSRWFRTPAVPAGSGPDFVNGAASLRSTLPPDEILLKLHAVEQKLGRTRPERWAPRVCDLDLLGHGGAVLPDLASVQAWMSLSEAEAGARTPEHLILPHPRMHLRAFVIVPLCDIAPDWVHPVLQLPVATLLQRLSPEMRAGIEPLD